MNKITGFLFLALALVACDDTKKVKEDNFVYKEDTTKHVQLDELAKVYNQLEKDPENVNLLVEVAHLCREAYDYDCAMNMSAKAYRIDSTRANVRKAYAWSLINQPNPKSEDILLARKHFKYVITKEPNNPEVYVNLANTYTLTGDFKNSFNYLDEALKIDKEYRDAYILKGSNYRLLDNRKLAISSFETALQLDQNYVEGYLNVADYYVEIGNEVALEYYQTALDLDPKIKVFKLKALYGIAKTNQDLENFDVALAGYRNLLRADSGFYQAYFNSAYIKQFEQKQIDSAIYFYNKCLDIKNRNVEAWHNLGLAYYSAGRENDAARAFSNALGIDENYEPSRQAAEKLIRPKY